MTLRSSDGTSITLSGSLLWTHFGASGPLALNLSRHWHRATSNGHDACDVLLNVCPDETAETLDVWLRGQSQLRPKARVATVLAARIPAALAEVLVRLAGIAHETTLAHLAKEERRALITALTRTPLPVQGSRGYGYAEVTAGGIRLDEIEGSTLESRLCAGLFFAGEILDVDGRLGGFNFQWAWSSAWVAAHGAARRLRDR
jgi:predicted Rossmann fold flavoprotein